MFAFLAAAAAATQVPAPQPAYQDDLRCMLAMAIVLGAQDDAPDAKDGQAQDGQDGLIGLVMYYVGKIDVKAPGLDYLPEIKRLVNSPNYMEKQFPNDAKRCADEAGSGGSKLEQLGSALISAGEEQNVHPH